MEKATSTPGAKPCTSAPPLDHSAPSMRSVVIPAGLRGLHDLRHILQHKLSPVVHGCAIIPPGPPGNSKNHFGIYASVSHQAHQLGTHHCVHISVKGNPPRKIFAPPRNSFCYPARWSPGRLEHCRLLVGGRCQAVGFYGVMPLAFKNEWT